MTDQWTPSGEPTPPTPARFSARTRLRRSEILRIGVVIGSLVVLVASAAVTIGATPTTSGSGASGAPDTTPAPSGNTRGPGFGGGPGGPGFGGGLGRLFAGPGGLGSFFFGNMGGPGGALRGPNAGPALGRTITIASLDGSNVGLTTDDGWTRTIAVTDTTQIRIGTQAGTLSDLKVGDVVNLSEKKNTDGTYAITLIVVHVPTIAGIVTDVTSGGFTVKQGDGSSKTVTTSGSTSFLLGTAKSSKSDLSVGARVQVEGTDGSGTSFDATVVHIVPDIRSGKVTATTGSTITIQEFGGATTTLHVDASTTYRVAGSTTGTLSDVTVGMVISAQGLSRADGSLDATSVFAGSFRRPLLPVQPQPSTSPG